ncbi:MAG: Myo-inositol 2-dehydrogenase [uncultured Friedmanniella sp.]|uniref:Myo-inositol 2-dehydrogenase n=1 Tax=uncultured Friedmanniella sp. TaxID=335381 RepID=A0A6J4KBW1_9ACTN|nr:Gfo/Idh/MocA family oxidoreductase [uncultured Friedmanniella sp.]CAA9300473.1 MAG: Myo-inositol 2-dehydrogenase [uncultured Friedmanniella sp.]
MAEPLRILQVGAGGMGRAWLRNLVSFPDAVLVGLVDLDLDRARAAAAEEGHPEVPVARDLTLLAAETGAQAVLDVTVPEAHQAVNTEAMRAGLPVLCEKPLAGSVSQCLEMVATAELTGQLLMVSQSRRYWQSLVALRDQLGQLGEIGTVSCEFFKAPRMPGFREEMAHPLLVDMAIHHLDLARLLLGADPVSVYCESANPPWSWFAGDAAATAVFAFPAGQRFTYTGSWVARGLETSWNGSWRVSAEHGTAVWDGDHPPIAFGDEGELPVRLGTGGQEIRGSLAEFVQAVRTGVEPDTVARRNVWSVAMVEAAIASTELGGRVLLEEVLESAYVEAVRGARDPDVRDVLQSWPSVQQGLAAR